MRPRTIGRRQLLTGGAALTLAGLGGSPARAAAGTSAALLYDAADAAGPRHGRAELEAFIDRYLDALLAHDPSQAPFAPAAIFAENNVRLPLGAASWRTLERLGRYRHYFADPEGGEAGLIANVYENGSGCILVLRLRIEDAHIVEAEQYVTRDPLGAENYEKLGVPDPVWLETIAPAQRQSRDALRAVAFMYFQALQHNDGTGVYPFREDCLRIEHARQVVNLPHVENYGHADAAVTFTTLKAKPQYELGMMAFVTRIRDRRFLVVDAERGVVLANAVYDFDGMLRSITFGDGRLWSLPAYFRTPRSNHANEAFKILNGSFRYIEMTFIETPFGMRAAWAGPKPTVSLAYWPQAAPVALRGPVSRATLEELMRRVLDAMVRHCPCELPLAPSFRYTENGIPLEPGTGLWQSATRLRDYQLTLADAERSSAGWFGALEERGLFAMAAVRLKLEGGYIAEIESVIARPEKPAQGGQLREATFTLFVPPLTADLEPTSFASLPVALTKLSPAARVSIAGATEGYHQASVQRNPSLAPLSPRAARRVNGHPADDLATGERATLTTLRGRRSLLLDEARGLALEVVLRDNAALSRTAPPEFRAPWTDLHVQLLKVEHGEIAHVEELVRRVPYGQGSGWE